MSRPIVLCAAAHPDDIEFMMAGTALLLRQAGAELHWWHLANGNCGSVRHGREELARLRAAEAQDSARVAGAVWHGPLFDDLAIFYDQPSLARVAAVVRQVRPSLVLTHSPQDYMEDHQNTCRLVVSAAFARGMPNFLCTPATPAYDAPVAIYHALPHGLHDGLRTPIRADGFVNITAVLPAKRELLAQHRSQKQWLDVSQGMDAYLQDMEAMSREVGHQSGRFPYAEGWRRHAHLGFGPAGYHPLQELLGGDYQEASA